MRFPLAFISFFLRNGRFVEIVILYRIFYFADFYDFIAFQRKIFPLSLVISLFGNFRNFYVVFATFVIFYGYVI